MNRLALSAIALIVLLAAALFWNHQRAPNSPAARHNVVLITVDTLRADRLGRGVAPALDGLAASGLRFTNARANVPLTLPSHVSLMTGTIPPVHGVRENGVRFGGRIPTLAQILRARGYRTGAFVGAYVLDRRFGLAEGFETYDDRVHRDPDAVARLEAERRGKEVVDAALLWLEATEAPLFLWIHLYDPHAPYDAPADYRRPGSAPYDDEVRYADAQVGRVLETLRARRLGDSTVLVVAGDHGEGLGEHGEQTHGLLAYDSTLRIPLVLTAPGVPPGEIAVPATLADVAPAVLKLLGDTGGLAPEASRLDLLSPRSDVDAYAETQYPRVAGWHALTVLAGERWKLIQSSEPELFDLRADPQELRNVAAEQAAVVEGMAAELARMTSGAAVSGSSSTVDAATAEKLRALGYVSGGTVTQAADPNAPNPASAIASWTAFERALAQLNDGRAADALPDLKALATRFPSGLVFQTTYARALQDTGKARDALRVLRAAVARWPADAALFHELAVAARSAGEEAEAMRAEQAALAIDEESPAALNGLGLLHADAGRPAEAADAFERATKADPSNASYWSNLGNTRRELGQWAAAQTAYHRALEADPAHADAANGLGVLLVQTGKPAEAIRWFEAALERSPDFHEARLNLGIAFQESGQREKAIAVYREVLGKAPERFARERKAAAELLESLK